MKKNNKKGTRGALRWKNIKYEKKSLQIYIQVMEDKDCSESGGGMEILWKNVKKAILFFIFIFFLGFSFALRYIPSGKTIKAK